MLFIISIDGVDDAIIKSVMLLIDSEGLKCSAKACRQPLIIPGEEKWENFYVTAHPKTRVSACSRTHWFFLDVFCFFLITRHMNMNMKKALTIQLILFNSSQVKMNTIIRSAQGRKICPRSAFLTTSVDLAIGTWPQK